MTTTGLRASDREERAICSKGAVLMREIRFNKEMIVNYLDIE